ncbi:thermonuclease family protein [Croceicoccus gelatinilyticus]|uniref:thermonuclease family protein n=1 Tax=Croceicoccus gelatinilyticus TaxID=2835536 RepID=UPI001BCF95D2|nr:thermonuclease family protein [Croceicoccus gelatinilyticus]MBS7671367.1 thermonuclease family protein [Croceicoccus gelatinilyticus]
MSNLLIFIIVGIAIMLIGNLLRWFFGGRSDWQHFPYDLVYVIDGDTVTIGHGRDKTRVRLAGFDCPELSQPGGRKAKQHLVKMLRHDGIWLRTTDVDAYGRLVAYGAIKGEGIARKMIRDGYAHADDQSRLWRFLVTLGPRLKGKGIWQGTFLGLGVVHPTDFRRRQNQLRRARGGGF